MDTERTHNCKDMNDRRRREMLAKGLRREWLEIDLTIVLVALASFGALIEVDVTKGISLIAGPLIVGFLVLRLNPSTGTWYLVFANLFSYLAFGFFGIFFLLIIPIWICLLIKSVGKPLTLTAALGVALLTLIVWAFNMPALGLPRPVARLSSDMANVGAISAAIDAYRSARIVYPDRLSQLQATGADLRVFESPRSMSEAEFRQSGPLRLLWGKPDPRVYRKIMNWSEVDGGDYLYLRPSTNAVPDTILLATRPGQLYKDSINVLYVGGKRVTLSGDKWRSDKQVLEFLETPGVSTKN